MKAIFKRELSSYFHSAIGYVLIAVFVCLSSIYFMMTCLLSASSDLSAVFQFIATWVLMVFAPILTMKLLSEEKKLKTDQLLITSPVSLTGIVVGKFLSAMTMFLISLSVMFGFLLVVMQFGNPPIASFFGNLIGIILLASAIISMGTFISSLTENQVVSAFCSFGLIIGLLLLSSFASTITNPFIATILQWFSVYSRFNDFAYGIFNIESVVYYISLTVVFLFLAVRVLEKKRWS